MKFQKGGTSCEALIAYHQHDKDLVVKMPKEETSDNRKCISQKGICVTTNPNEGSSVEKN